MQLVNRKGLSLRMSFADDKHEHQSDHALFTAVSGFIWGHPFDFNLLMYFITKASEHDFLHHNNYALRSLFMIMFLNS